MAHRLLPAARALGALPPAAGAWLWRGLFQSAPGKELDNFYDNEIEKLSLEPLRPISLQRMLEFGWEVRDDPSKQIESARFVQREIPKRLARRLMDLQFLPYVVVTNPHIKRVYNSYYTALMHMRGMREVASLEDNEKFSTVLKTMVDEHAPMLNELAEGLRECKSKPVVGDHIQLDSFLDNMLQSRISRRVLAEQHIMLTQRREGYIGIICSELELQGALEYAVARTQQVCELTYGVAPEYILDGDTRAVVPYITAHLDYMMFELLKNASRAAVEFHGRRAGGGRLGGLGGGRVPKVRVMVMASDEDVTIRVSDQGGGIPPGDIDNIWKYGYTTASGRASEAPDGGSSGSEGGGGGVVDFTRAATGGGEGGLGPDATSPMAGLGFGLPLSRLYARYFGGDLHLVTMPGYGSDAYLRISKLGTTLSVDI